MNPSSMLLPSVGAKENPGRSGAWSLAIIGAVLPAALFLDDNLAYNLFYLLCAFGLWLAVRYWRAGTLSTEEVLLAVLGTAVPLTALLSYMMTGSDPRAWAHIQEAQLPLAGILLVALVFRGFSTPSTIWFIALVTGAVIGALAINDLLPILERIGWVRIGRRLMRGLSRSSGSNNSVVFGGVALVFTVLCAFALRQIWGKVLALRLVSALAFILCVLGLLLSGTRGAWIAIPVVVFAVMLALRTRATMVARTAAVVAVLAMVLAYQIPGIHKRVQRAVQEYSQYERLPADQPVSGSVGMRLEGWHLAWELSKAHPVWGAGPGMWVEGVTAMNAEHGTAIRIDLEQFNHPHNEFLSALALRGVVGLIGEVLLLAWLLRAFWRRTGHPDSGVQLLALAGVAVVVGIIVLGLSAVPLGWWRINSIMYAFVLGALYGSMRGAERGFDSSQGALSSGVAA